MMWWSFEELGERPVDAITVRNADQARVEVWWRGVLIAWASHRDQVVGGNARLDWNEVRRALEGGG